MERKNVLCRMFLHGGAPKGTQPSGSEIIADGCGIDKFRGDRMKYYIRKSRSGKGAAWLLMDAETGRIAATADDRATIDRIAANLRQGKQGLLDPGFVAPVDQNDDLKLSFEFFGGIKI